MKINLHEIFPQYELIDCGNGLKLERFNNIVLIRPDVTAIDIPKFNIKEWKNLANAEFIEKSKNQGDWVVIKSIPNKWNLHYLNKRQKICGELSLTNSKHIGVFPEQVLNWNYIAEKSINIPSMQFLNIFGYTGLSSVAAAPFSEKVTHIDSIKKIVDWTKRNAELSGYDNLRYITEDAFKFVTREIKRGSKYNGVILDPPPIGMGANNEKWILEEMIDDLLLGVRRVLSKKSFVIMNLYSHSITEKFIHRLVLTYFRDFKIDFCEKVYGKSKTGNLIDHGFFIRLSS